MKKNLLYALFFLFGFIVVSCSDDDNVEPARYYVQYDVTFTTQHVNANREIKVATEKGIQTISLENQAQTVTWSRTYGPVNKNFLTSIECSTPGYTYRSTIHAKISVSREKEPFVLKAENEGDHSVALSYKIDF